MIPNPEDGHRTVKVAVVGTGLAGLTAAYLLTDPSLRKAVKFEVHLFEKASTFGMDSSSVSIVERDQDFRIDVPMRSFQGGYYTNLIALYKKLGVKFRQADFSYSFSSLHLPTRKMITTMIYNGGSGRSGVSKPSSFGESHGDIKHQGLIADLVRKVRISILFACLTTQLLLCYLITLFHALPFRRPSNISNIVFRDWAVQATPSGRLSRLIGFDTAWKDYVQTILIPLLSAVCTAPETDILYHPVEEILGKLHMAYSGNTSLCGCRGVRDVVARLTARVHHVHLSSKIVAVERDAHDHRCISVSAFTQGAVKIHAGFHHIILATQANGAVPILKKYLQALDDDSGRREVIERQIKCLELFQYRTTIVVNHTDETLLPCNETDARDLNLVSVEAETGYKVDSKEIQTLCVPPSYTMATHILAVPSGHGRTFQTTNPIIAPNKDRLLGMARLERAIVSRESKLALSLLCVESGRKWWQCSYEGRTCLGELQGGGGRSEAGMWICGSYAHLGIPLLEGCVVSARNVVEQGILAREGVCYGQEKW